MSPHAIRKPAPASRFTPKALAKMEPVSQEARLCELSAERVRFRAARGRERHDFSLDMFQMAGRLPWPV